jgi:hypothetical protein
MISISGLASSDRVLFMRRVAVHVKFESIAFSGSLLILVLSLVGPSHPSKLA